MSSTTRFLLAAATTTAALALANQASGQVTLGCTTGGTGGAIPTSGTGDGTFSTVLPSAPLVATLTVPSIPVGAVCVTAVTIHGLSHTYIGDLQFVLTDPGGVPHNIFCRPGGGGFSCDFAGDYTIVEAGGTNLIGPCTTTLAPGTYNEFIGTWPSGSNGIDNALFSAITAAPGNWSLTAYDWAAIDIGSMVSWDICFGTPPPPPPPPPSSTCVTPMGGGGTFPTTGSGDGTWPTSMPTAPLVDTIAVTVPSGATKVVDIKLNGISHTWVGDIMITLKDPSGIEHNVVHRPGSLNGGLGNNCDISGDYRIFQTFGNDFAGQCSPGDYFQSFGDWPTGTNGIMNTLLESIPAISGNWSLSLYDWAGGDIGVLTSWELCFDVPSGPTAYCTSGTSTNGCVPSISASAQPSATYSHPCSISIANLEGQKFGIIFYGINNTGFTPTVWANGSNSYLCVKGPTQRTGTSNSGGTVNLCNGVLSLNWNTYQIANPSALGHPFAAGNHVFVQGWYRDPPAPKTTNLSNALNMTVTP